MIRDNKVLLYTAVLRPILSYGCPVWGYAAKISLIGKISLTAEPEQKELIASAIKDRNKQSTSIIKYVSKNCHTNAASYSAANAIARHGKPFQEGEFLKEAWLDNKKNDINSAPFISLCLDESIGITKLARLAVFARYCAGNIIKEELIAITSLLTTKGTDICTAVRNSLAEKEIDLKKIVSVTTDGAPNMILECHCIIHQQALWTKSGLTSLDNVITLVTKIVHLISSQTLNKRKFDALLDEVNSVYNGLITYNNARWLSRWNVLQRFVDCLEEIRLFLQKESKIEQYPQLMDIMWLL
ncbi:general transcription factor II-I repeat domain-containing protein 2A [Trichonephila clavipes]|nr:general transcription factor II-I repeat domain-containing protein 2A [Trichonephila clavipes]